MAAKRMDRELILEIAVAIIVAIFVFSIIGSMNSKSSAGTMQEKPSQLKKETAKDIGQTSSVKVSQVYGTNLSPASKSFEVLQTK